jgi:RNA polymerase sigma-70 factor (ECF subfamily)
VSPLLAKRLSDETLGSRLASGEAAAFDELYRRYVHRLAAYGAHLLGDGAAGDDVAQATMLKVYGTLRDGRVPERMKPWLYRIAHNVAIDLVVRRREWPTAELPERSGSDTAPIAGALVAALVALPERQRRVYVLRELHGLRIDETAAELSLSATQVEQSLFAARNRLAEHLVFGDRLTCVSVQRLAAGPLDRDERRALKSHLRSCPSCRSSLGLRGRALSTPPVSLEWLRGLLSGALGGGAPVVAKVGAAVATVSFAAGVPAAVETVPVHPPPFRVPVRAAPIAHARVTARTRVTRARPAVATVAFSRTSVGGHTSRRGRGGGSDDRSSVSSSTASARSGDDVRARSSDTGSSHEGPAGGELPVVASSSGGSGSDGGGSNAASQQSGGGPGPSTTTVTTVVVATPTPTGDGGPGSGVGSGSGISGSGGSDQAVRSGSDGGGSIDGRDGGGGGDDGKDGGGGDGGGYPLTGR